MFELKYVMSLSIILLEIHHSPNQNIKPKRVSKQIPLGHTLCRVQKFIESKQVFTREKMKACTCTM